MSIGEYLKNLRMQKAGELLETTSLNVKEVAAAVGMRDQSHFVRAFKKSYGLTPSQYRDKTVSPVIALPRINKSTRAAKDSKFR